MNKKQLIAAGILFLMFLSGCETFNPYIQQPAQVPLPHIHNDSVMTEIISDPPGAKIEINSQYVGDTPLTVHIFRTFELLGWNGFTITATPVYQGQYVQRKYIDLNEPTPTKVYFNMYLH